MRAQWRHRVLALGSLGLLTVVSGHAQGNGHFHRGYAAVPTTYVEVLPSTYVTSTSYVIPTVYAQPTSYVLPTVYSLPRSYVIPTTYVDPAPAYLATSYALSPSYAYVAPTVYTSRPVPTQYDLTAGYLPTAYAYPRAYQTPPASDPCDPCVVQAPCYNAPSPAVATSKPYPYKAQAARGEGSSATRPAPSVVDSVPAQGGSTNPEPTTSRSTGRPSNAVEVDPNFSTPPKAPAQDKDGGAGEGAAAAPPGSLTPITPGAGGVEPQPAPPVAPGGEAQPVEVPLPPDAGTVRHQSQKPVGPGGYVRTARDKTLNKLQGKVISVDDGRPEEGVRVTFTNRSNTFVDRNVLTDAFGRYAVTLPDGDWTVKVAMPSGRTYPVSQLLVSKGQISDEAGRDIPSLIINR